MTPLDRSTIWPYEDGEPGASTTSATAIRPASRPSARSASSRRPRCSSPPARARRPRSSSRCSSRAARSRSPRTLLRDGRPPARARALGPADRRVRPDRAAARRRGPRLDRGAVEPAPDDAGLRGGRRPSGAGRRRLDRGDADPPAPARARRRLRAPQRDEVPRRATTTSSSAPWSPRPREDYERLLEFRTAQRDRRRAGPGVAAAARARDAARSASSATPRLRASSCGVWRPTPPSSTSATRASAACSPSTSPAAQKPRGAWRPRRG